MSQHFTTNNSQPITIFYEVISADPQQDDPAELQSVVDTVVEALTKEGYLVEPVSEGKKGWDFLFQIIPQVVSFVQSSVQIATTHKDEITAAVKSVTPVIERIEALRKERAAKKAEQQSLGGIDCEMTFGADSDSFKFTSTDQIGTEQFQTALDKFLEHSQHTKPQPQPRIVDAQGPTLTIRERVPPRPRRKKY